MAKIPDDRWMSDFQARVNRDPELALIGQHFTADVLLEVGTKRFVLKVREGRLVDVVPEPGFDVSWSFALRAPLEHWRKFAEPTPPPLFNSIFAMLMRVPEFRLEGNTLAAVQNARALYRFTSLMRPEVA